MKKFEINSDNLCVRALLDCIIEKSAFAVKAKPFDYYTYYGNPGDWTNSLIADARKALRADYRRRTFYLVKSEERICHVLYQGDVYYFDEYFSDCPILASILARPS